MWSTCHGGRSPCHSPSLSLAIVLCHCLYHRHSLSLPFSLLVSFIVSLLPALSSLLMRHEVIWGCRLTGLVPLGAGCVQSSSDDRSGLQSSAASKICTERHAVSETAHSQQVESDGKQQQIQHQWLGGVDSQRTQQQIKQQWCSVQWCSAAV